MGHTTVNVRVDSDVKQGIEAFCEEVGMNISTAVNIFFKAILIQNKIPFEITLPDEPRPKNKTPALINNHDT
jgi:DNA-damage-inducible protein J